ncbi:MAG: TIGR02530 family flagellar biosynthesis protein [Fimbriimonadales bacterium]
MSTPINNSKVRELIQSQTPQTTAKTKSVGASGPAFSEILSKQLELKLSGHAQTRLKSRGIELGESEWNRVKSGIDRAAQKGSKESLVLLDDVALVVSVRNRTVITAVSQEQLKENVFTNIDSAVIV